MFAMFVVCQMKKQTVSAKRCSASSYRQHIPLCDNVFLSILPLQGLAALLNVYERKNGTRSSGLLIVLWLSLVVWSTIKLRTYILKEMDAVSTCMCVCPSVCVCVSVCLSVSVCVCVCLSVSVCVCVCLSVSVCVCVCLSVSVVCVSVCLSVCLSIVVDSLFV